MAGLIGENTYKGLGVPLRGHSQLIAESTAPILTFRLSSESTNARFVMGMDNPTTGNSSAIDLNSSVVEDLMKWDIDEAGGYRAVSGTTVLMELNSSGLYAGTDQIVNADGGFVGARVALTAATTLHTLLSSNAGKLHTMTTVAASSVFIHLPSSGNAAIGDRFEFAINTSAAGILHFMTTGANAGGEIHAHIDSTNTIISTGAVSNVTSGPLWWEFMCVSTVGPVWALQNKMTQSNNSTAQLHTVAAATTA